MKISILTLFPQMFQGFLNESMLKKAQDKKLVLIELINLRDFAVDDYGSVDDKPYGGGVGMVLRVDVVHKALMKITNEFQNINSKTKIVLTSARGIQYTQTIAGVYTQLNHLIIIAGHYEGIDERILSYVDEEISIGDYVLTGGEIPAAVIIDSVVRLIPGVLKKDATIMESFQKFPCKRLNGKERMKTLLEYPQYTRPEIYKGKKVPTILLSGDHEKIQNWRKKQAVKITKKRRPDLLK